MNGARGFTLIELLVAMGLLSGFLLMLVQLVGSGAELFDRGERSQELADRALTAQRAVDGALGAMVGPRVDVPAGETPVDARLIVHRLAAGSAQPDDPPPPQVQVLRSTVRLAPAREEALVRAGLEHLVADETGANVAEVRSGQVPDLVARLADLLAGWPRRGRGELLLTAWPAEDPAAAAAGYLDLRAGYRIADPELLGPDELPLVDIADPRDLHLDPGTLRRTTRRVAGGLLHVGFELWSQDTEDWDATTTNGPLAVWDSARAGLMLEPEGASSAFPFDRGPASLRDPRDDIWPRWIRVTLVVAGPAAGAPAAYLAQPLGVRGKTAVVTAVERLPDPLATRFVKIGTEWVQYAADAGRRLEGLRRGQRGTTAQDHPAGTAVRAGKPVQFVLPVPHGKDHDG